MNFIYNYSFHIYFVIIDLNEDKFIFTSELIPPNISLTYVLAFIKIKIAPIRINLQKVLLEVRFKENINKRIIETNTWTNIKDIKDFIHELNKIDVVLLHKERNAKGESITKIFINTYLTAYVIIKFNKPTEIRVLIIPSKEKISKFSLIDITEFNFLINSEKQILVLNKYSPICLILLDSKEMKYIISSQRNKEKFIQIPQRINLKINWPWPFNLSYT